MLVWCFYVGSAIMLEQIQIRQKIDVTTDIIVYRTEHYFRKIDKMLGEFQKQIEEPDYEKIVNATISVHNVEAGTSGAGVAIIYNNEKYILSAFHLDNSDEIYVYDLDFVKMEKIIWDADTDLLLLKPTKELKTVEYIEFIETETKIGEKIWLCGNPMGIDRALTYGNIIKKSNDNKFFMTDAAMWFGNSGGGAFNSKTQLIGIATQIYAQVDFLKGMSFHYGIIVDAESISEFLKGVNNGS